MGRQWLCMVAACVLGTSSALADVKLPAVISDNMVLQKTVKAPIWGWASPGENVKVKFNDQTASATADRKGAWKVSLDTSKQGAAPSELVVTGNNALTVKNVVVGEVWLASGQSNMELMLKYTENAEAEIARASNPQLRHFRTAYHVSSEPQAETEGAWVVCTPETAAGFTAVGYYFAKALHQEIKVPVGLVHTSWGGTEAEAWTSAEGLSFDPRYAEVIATNRAISDTSPAAMEKRRKEITAWLDTVDPKEPPNTGFDKGWARADFDDSGWKTMQCPTNIESAGLPEFDGSVWFRKTIELPAALTGKDLLLSLGTISDLDTTYVNGTQVGATDAVVDNYRGARRRYPVPAKLLKAGKNVIAVRMFNASGKGGLMGPSTEMNIGVEKETVSLSEAWQYQVETQVKSSRKGWRGRPGGLGLIPNSPTALYNAMVHPLVPYAIAGTIWYQGENNAGRAFAYRTLFPAMIADWRSKWGQGDFPFYYVQLAAFQPVQAEPVESEWAELREAQLMTLKVANTGMAVTIDIGDAVDIHPRNKADVGKRLALNALAKTYGKKTEFTGPMYESMKVEGGKIRLKFAHAAGLQAGMPDPNPASKVTPELKGFAICGADRKFVWAAAAIDGDTVVVSAAAVAEPMAVRYAWANNPVCNLYNGAGLPASPFRTDDFAGKTAPKMPAPMK